MTEMGAVFYARLGMTAFTSFHEVQATLEGGRHRRLRFPEPAVAKYREKAGSPLDLEGLHALVQLVSGSSDEIESIHAFVPAVARTIAKTSLSGTLGDLVHDQSVGGYLYVFQYTPSTAAARDLWGPSITVGVRRLRSRAAVELYPPHVPRKGICVAQPGIPGFEIAPSDGPPSDVSIAPCVHCRDGKWLHLGRDSALWCNDGSGQMYSPSE